MIFLPIVHYHFKLLIIKKMLLYNLDSFIKNSVIADWKLKKLNQKRKVNHILLIKKLKLNHFNTSQSFIIKINNFYKKLSNNKKKNKQLKFSFQNQINQIKLLDVEIVLKFIILDMLLHLKFHNNQLLEFMNLILPVDIIRLLLNKKLFDHNVLNLKLKIQITSLKHQKVNLIIKLMLDKHQRNLIVDLNQKKLNEFSFIFFIISTYKNIIQSIYFNDLRLSLYLKFQYLYYQLNQFNVIPQFQYQKYKMQQSSQQQQTSWSNNDENELEQNADGNSSKHQEGSRKKKKQDEHKQFEERLKNIPTGQKPDAKIYPEEWVNKWKQLLLKQQNKK
ncbi:unnamed protein product [Paramecium sonneborni]|uniref:Uncharacterized protein n=1 Tax=Paramecium sonneborni TaxID=65129 RepID=A0A8S1QQF0_9CILI|nr:unnamed protein product [Paramecium sonneborni]